MKRPRARPVVRRPARAARRIGRGTPRRGQARRPGPPLRRRLAGRLPPWRRLLAALGALAGTVGLALLLTGPWLRITDVTWAGARFTDPDDVAELLEPQRGENLLAVGARRLEVGLEALPAVAEASVVAELPGTLSAGIVERTPVLVWQTHAALMLVGDDGMLFAALARGAEPPTDLAALPRVEDRRHSGRLMRVGDVIPPSLADVARQLADIDPQALGSVSGRVEVSIDDEYGFMLVSADPAWRAAFGFYGTEPDDVEQLGARIERQVASVRTLFAAEPESGIGWVDARNPGKVYFRAKG